jgi:uncharacterized protein
MDKVGFVDIAVCGQSRAVFVLYRGFVQQIGVEILFYTERSSLCETESPSVVLVESTSFFKISKRFVFPRRAVNLSCGTLFTNLKNKTMSYNPFVTGPMIQNPLHFVGRIRESEDIIAKIRGNNAVSIVGERRIGKSSLLWYLKHVCSVQFLERRAVYLDFMDIETHTLEDFVYLLLGQLRIQFDSEELTKKPTLTLTRQLRQFNLDNPPPIVFLDEFDKIQDLKTLFNDDFLENLRFLCNKGYLCLVTGSKTPLKEMMDKKGLTSPLWNIFTQTSLKEFVVEEALDERSLFLEQYWCAENNLMPTDGEMRFLLSYTSAHPLVMQIVSDVVCQNRYAAVKRTDAQLRELIAERTTSHFRTSKDKIRHWLYSSSVSLPKNIEWTTDFIGKNLKNLNPLKDLKIIG